MRRAHYGTFCGQTSDMIVRHTSRTMPLPRSLRALLAGLLAAAAAGGVAATGLLGGLERNLLDARYALRGTHAAPGVAVVAIDAEAIARDGPWPFRRTLHARAIRRLLAAGARAVVYDVQFSEPSAHPADDRALIAAAADARVVLATVAVTRAGRPVVIGLDRLRAGGGHAGFALFPVDADGVWRRMQGSVAGVPTIDALATGVRASAAIHPIDFSGPSGHVRTLSFDAVLRGRFDATAVRDRIVVVGLTDKVEQDVHATAAGGDLMSGAELHANAIQTILDGYPLGDAPGIAGVLLVLAAGLLAPLAALPGRPERAVLQALGAGALGAAALLGGAQLAFDGGTILPATAPLSALLFGTAAAIALTYGLEVRARRRLRTTFERFVPAQVAEQLLPRDGAAARVAARQLEATVVFCDLRGFTTLAERLDAEQTIAVLNRYLTAVSSAVLDHGGTVVSYQGDGVLAVFGAPLPQPDHASRALAAAREVLHRALPAFNRWLADERLSGRALDAGIGLNTGPVMSGLVGSERRLEYAAVGDATNVAARLQALGRELPGRLFVSGTTYAALGGATDGLRRHGDVELRGRAGAVTVYVED
jgi:adenylate cyclase